MDKLFDQIIGCRKCLEYGVDYSENRKQNLVYAYNYKPDSIDILWIVESPPGSDPPRYFYRPELTRFDSLFREVMKSLDIFPSNPKTDSLTRFKSMGHFLIDAAKCPVDKSNAHLKPKMIANCRNLLQAEVKHLDPEKIFIVKSSLYRDVFNSLKEIGFHKRVLNSSPIPFPGSGRQREFREEVARYIE